MTDRCPICGESIVRHEHATYTYQWPARIAQRETEFTDATWDHCTGCGEDYIPASLLRRIESEYKRLRGER